MNLAAFNIDLSMFTDQQDKPGTHLVWLLLALQFRSSDKKNMLLARYYY